ncbi:MAG: hypothetical protein IPP19_15495 [Verrucomicrobia bacterium]|nr:hypothetical protein [Verrucomicrobiota bacterium]
MNLKKATKLVYFSLIAQLVMNVVQWAAYSFRFYGAFGQDFSTVMTLLHFVLSIPMILFFGALNAKQNTQPGTNQPESAN